MTDHFLCLGKPTQKSAKARNKTTYVPDAEGSRYYIWTSATVRAQTKARIAVPSPEEPAHASELLLPAAVYLNGQKLPDLKSPLDLNPGANPLLIRYDHAGRGYFVLRREPSEPVPKPPTPLAMQWYDDRSLIPFDPLGGAGAPEWFRFVAPPGFRAMQVQAKGEVEAWLDGKPMAHKGGQGKFEAADGAQNAAVVALRVKPEPGFSGGAILPEAIRIQCGPGQIALGDWGKLGALECYSGGAWYRKTVMLRPEQAKATIVLDLGDLCSSAEVRFNGKSAGTRVAPPWRFDLSHNAKPGENRLEVFICNTLANHYQTIPTRYRTNTPSGLIGPVSLEITK